MNTETQLRISIADTPITEIYYFESTGSTNTVALEKIKSTTEVRDWTLIYADSQTAGRGRFERKWVMQPGASLAFTLILLPKKSEIERLPLFSPMAALAVCSALEKVTGLSAKIKWPNDVLLNRKKMCGILAETSWQGESLGGVALGIGINVSPGSVPTDGSALFPPTCIEAEYGRQVDRFKVLAETLRALETWRKALGSPDFFDAWMRQMAFIGEEVNLEQTNGAVISGILKGVSTSGDLLLVMNNGSVESYSVGDVRLRPANPGLRAIY